MNTIFVHLIILFSFPFCGFVVETVESRSSQVEKIQAKINTLGPGTSFTYVDLGLTENELILIDQLKFDYLPESTKQYDRFGNLHLLKEELPAFLRQIGNDDENVIQAVTEIISRTAGNITKAAHKESAWVCVRASTPNHDFDIPRWHMDGQYYGPYPYPGMVFKFGAVLKGPPTLLYYVSQDIRDKFNANQNDRIFLSELLNVHAAESPKRGQGVLFIVADDNMGAVHSEPRMDENRLFFSVLVGDESEIHELYSRWHPEKH